MYLDSKNTEVSVIFQPFIPIANGGNNEGF